MKDSKFAVGDVVTLNSGSPNLTVVSSENGSVVVTWLAAFSAQQSLELPEACFKLARSESAD